MCVVLDGYLRQQFCLLVAHFPVYCIFLVVLLSVLIIRTGIFPKIAVGTGKNNRFPFLDILGYLKNTHKNPKFGRVRQVPTRELGWEFPGLDLSHFAKFGIFMGIL